MLQDNKPSVAWISHFPIEWWDYAPSEFKSIPKAHPAPWQRVLLHELMRQHPELQIHVIALRKTFPKSASFTQENVTFHLVKTAGGLRASTLFWYDTFKIWQVVRFVRPWLIHCWGTEWCAPWIAYRLRYPFIVTMQGILSWYSETAPPQGVSGRVYFKLGKHCERRFLSKALLVTTESRYGIEYLKTRFSLDTVWQVEHPPGDVFFKIHRCPRTRPVQLLFVGHVTPRKGVDIMLRALEKLIGVAEFEVVLIGGIEQPFFDQLLSGISPRLRERLIVRGVCDVGKVVEALGEATILVMPTRADTSPNAVKEAAVAGVPVVGTRVGGIPDYIIDGKNGILCNPDDVEDLARALREALSHPLFSCGVVDEQVHRWVREYLSPTRMGERFWEAYCYAFERIGRK